VLTDFNWELVICVLRFDSTRRGLVTGGWVSIQVLKSSAGIAAVSPRKALARARRKPSRWSQHHASLPFGGTSEVAIRDLARREVHPMLAALVAATSQPFLQTIVDVAPNRTVFGRVCLGVALGRRWAV
jgi:hypothetical protein